MKNLFSTTGLLAAFAAAPALAQENLEIIGAPIDGKMGFQPAATELARDIHALDNLLLIVITIITVFVTALMLWCIYRFQQKAQSRSSKLYAPHHC